MMAEVDKRLEEIAKEADRAEKEERKVDTRLEDMGREMEVMIEKEKKEMGVGDWLYTLLIVGVPIFGTVLLIVWSLSKKTCITKRKFSRAYLLFKLITYIVSLIVLILFINIGLTVLDGILKGIQLA